MFFRRLRVFAVLVLLALPWAVAQAGWRVGVRIGVPIYYRPYPYRVYVAPGPVYLAPAPVYVQPTPVYVQPVPAYAPPAAVPAQAAPTAVPPAPPGYPELPPQPVPIK